MASSYQIEPIYTGYGKTGVRLMKIKRNGKFHEIKEIEVATQLKICDFNDYLFGDNGKLVPTDTQKNTIYALAKDHLVGRFS